jgi:hypothetical protein
LQLIFSIIKFIIVSVTIQISRVYKCIKYQFYRPGAVFTTHNFLCNLLIGPKS